MNNRYPKLIFPLPIHLNYIDFESNQFPSFTDPIRKQIIILTPEEWVRQHLLDWLICGLNYPVGLLRVEFPHNKGRMHGRSDVLVFDRNANALLLAECKSAKIVLSQNTIGQAASYNTTLGAPFLLITNGLSLACYWFDKKNKRYNALKQIPSFEQALELTEDLD